MKTIFIAEPVVTAGNSNRLIAVEILSRFYSVNGKQLPTVKTLNMFTAEMKIDLLELQIRKIISKASFFSKHNILCSLNVDYETCQYIYRNKNIQDIIKSYDFIVLEISETYPVIKADDAIIPFLINLSEHIWLDDLGSGNSTIHTLIRNKFQAVKLDKNFFQIHSMKPHFAALIDNIKRLCPLVIAEGVENKNYLHAASGAGLWGVQGYYFPSVQLEDIHQIKLDFSENIS